MYSGRLSKMPMVLDAVMPVTARAGVDHDGHEEAGEGAEAERPSRAENTPPRGDFWADI